MIPRRALFTHLAPKLSSHFGGRALVDFRVGAGAPERVRIFLHFTGAAGHESALADLTLLARDAGFSVCEELHTRHSVSVDILCDGATERKSPVSISFLCEDEFSARESRRALSGPAKIFPASLARELSHRLSSLWSQCRSFLRPCLLRPAPLK